MRTVSLAALQFSCSWTRDDNIAKADRLVRQAARQGAQVVLLPELFETPYFCAVQNPDYYALAQPLTGHPTVAHFRRLAAELGLVIVVSLYERAGMALFNSAVVIDADGEVVGHYRKSHIPQTPGYEEKYYFSPGRHRLKTHCNGLRQAGARHLLGPMVSRSRACARATGRGVPDVPDGDRQRNRTTRASIPWSIGGSSCADMPAPIWCRWLRQTASVWKRPTACP